MGFFKEALETIGFKGKHSKWVHKAKVETGAVATGGVMGTYLFNTLALANPALWPVSILGGLAAYKLFKSNVDAKY
jgi:hypothetical protein